MRENSSVSSPPTHTEWPSVEALPPSAGAYRDLSTGRLYRKVRHPLGATEHKGERVAVFEWQVRSVALTLTLAREFQMDYFHPADCPCGTAFETWIREGRKPERERVENLGATYAPTSPRAREISLDQLLAEGGRWPPPFARSERVFDLEDDSRELIREAQLSEAASRLATEMGEPGKQIQAHAKRLRTEQRNVERAIDALQLSPRGRKPLSEQLPSGVRNYVERGYAIKHDHPTLTWDLIAEARLGIPASTFKKWRRAYTKALGSPPK